MKYLCLKNVKVDGKLRKLGEVINLDAKAAEPLLEWQAVEKVKSGRKPAKDVSEDVQ